MSSGANALYMWRKLEKSMSCHIQRLRFSEGNFFRVKSFRILVSEKKWRTVFPTEQTLVLITSCEAFMKEYFSFELKEDTDIVIFYWLKESQSTALTDVDCKFYIGLCMQLNRHWGCCWTWREDVLSGTGFWAGRQWCWRGSQVSHVTGCGLGRGNTKKRGKSQLDHGRSSWLCSAQSTKKSLLIPGCSGGAKKQRHAKC